MAFPKTTFPRQFGTPFPPATVLSGGDTVAPTVVITSSESSPSAASPIPITITFSEAVTGFTSGDLTLDGTVFTSVTDFATADNIVWTCNAVIGTAGTGTINIAAGVCTDAAGNENTAASQFSLVCSVYLVEEFATDASAPLTSPRTCVPGPGSLTFTDTGNHFSIASGILTNDGTTAGAYDPGVISSGVPRTAGVALFTSMARAGGSASPYFGLRQAATGGATNGVFWNNTLLDSGQDSAASIYTVSSNVYYDIAIILRATGHFVVVNNRLAWVSDYENTATQYIVTGATAAGRPSGKFKWLHVLQLASPWTSDAGILTSSLTGARNAGDTFTHEGNTLIQFSVTTIPSADQIELRFRMQDTSNYWQVTIDSTGAIDLDEVVSGTPTQRASVAGVIANGDLIRIQADGTKIKVWEGVAAGSATTLRINYATASNFATETDGELETLGTGGAVSNIKAFPMDLTGTAYSELIRGGSTPNPFL